LDYIIVGADPGKTSAIACIGLDGRVLHMSTARFAGIDWFVQNIRAVGTPVVIAGDRKRPGAMLSELSAIFDAVLFSPECDLAVERKAAIANAGAYGNFHERDALAAAITAFNAYSGKLRQAERLAKRSDIDMEKVKAMVIRKYSIHDIVNNLKAGRRLVRGART
jgi:predicted RNase H-like nuclease (RuvC/YqgF family)